MLFGQSNVSIDLAEEWVETGAQGGRIRETEEEPRSRWVYQQTGGYGEIRIVDEGVFGGYESVWVRVAAGRGLPTGGAN